jgi:DNA polymerase-3 subunit beta
MKKIIIPADKLRPALKRLALAVPGKAALPVLSNLYCRVEKDQIELITTDLEITIKCRCEAETHGDPFEMLLPFAFLHRVVNLIHSGPVEIELNGKNYDKARITGPNDKYDLNVIDHVDIYPKLPPVPKQRFLKLEKSFIDWLPVALATICEDTLRPAMTHVLLDVKAAELIMVSTDASSIFTHKFIQECSQEDQLLLSARVVKAIADFPGADVSWSAKNIGFHADNVTVIARRPEARFPDYKVVIPKTEKNLAVNRGALIAALERCSLTSDASVKTTLIFNKEPAGTVELQAIDVDMDRLIDVTIDGEYTGDVPEFTVNASRLLKLLYQVENETINLAVSSATKGVVLTADEDPEYLGMIMPLASK